MAEEKKEEEEQFGFNIKFYTPEFPGSKKGLQRAVCGYLPFFKKNDEIFQLNEKPNFKQIGMLVSCCVIGDEKGNHHQFTQWVIYPGKWNDNDFSEYASKSLENGICVAQIEAIPLKQFEEQMNKEDENKNEIEEEKRIKNFF
jgi:hypothetical protein